MRLGDGMVGHRRCNRGYDLAHLFNRRDRRCRCNHNRRRGSFGYCNRLRLGLGRNIRRWRWLGRGSNLLDHRGCGLGNRGCCNRSCLSHPNIAL